MAQSKKITELKTIPFTGGQNTKNEPGLLPSGSYSSVQNMRQMLPGLKQRAGMIKQHSTADFTNRVMSMFQFSKGKRTERHFYAQMSDGDVLEATTNPPAVTMGPFGSHVFDGASGSIPASWSVLNEKMIYSNGVDQHQICAGTADYVQHFAVYDSDTKLPEIPTTGTDYTAEVSDANATTVAVLDGLGNFVATSGTVTCTQGATDFTGSGTKFLTELTVGQPVYVDAAEKNVIATITSDTAATVTTAWAAGHATKSYTTSNDCLLICSPVMPNIVTFTVYRGNNNASVSCISYPTATGWKVATAVDGTKVAGSTIASTGDMTWTQPTDAVPKYMYDKNGFWVKIAFTAALDSEVEVSSVTYGSGFTSIQDVWDGSLVDAIEAQYYKASTGVYYTYGSTSITLDGAASGDEVYFNSPDPIIAAYIDVGGAPNTTSSTTIDHFEYLAPSGSWTTVGSYSDGSTGLSRSGFVTFNRTAGIKPMQFNGVSYGSYWYRFGVDKTLSATVNIGIQVIPYYDISIFGVGICNAVWKDKMVYVFDQDPSWMYITQPDTTQVLSSSASAIFQAGDGRANKILSMKPFYNELIIGQEEKGDKGGCITLLQGTDPENFGKINISNYYGILNSQCMEVVESVEGGHNAFILSKRGILFTDGKVIDFVKGFEQVSNYFDPSSSTCIRTGYESLMYLKYDSSYRVLKIGLVSGSSATQNNVFLVYDLLAKCFMQDTYANNLSCECECEAASGSVPMIQMGGGQANGTVYVLNSGLNDVSTAVDASVTIELNENGNIARTEEMIIRAKAQAAGDMTVTPYKNGVVQSSLAKTLSLTPENANERIRRHRIPVNFKDQNVSVKIRHNTASGSFYLLDWAAALEEYSEQ